ncbi:TetR/AcrR family transcriptional regulator [Rhodococcus sp. NPDC060090]|uniref:TetR/AcrR family transcriptional regulator n=1 Tax=Rhodococcus sp. NPDC060090 TaxID=3347056 RepID=UPI0036463CE6
MGPSERTRERLQATAVSLFAEEGYDAVTVDRIAAAAGVSHMTFFRHFPSKDAVLLDDPYDPVIAEAVAAQPADNSPLERACHGILTAWTRIPEEHLGDVRLRLQIAVSHPVLRARMWENTLDTQEAIAGALRSHGVSTLDADVAAGACVGALMAALTDWARHGEEALGARITQAMHLLVPQAES